jgi:uncharacterized membrane protein
LFLIYQTKNHLKMNIALWIIQGILAAMFGMAGVMKSIQPIEKLAPKLPWVNDFSPAVVRLVGISELLGAIGLIVPWATGIQPILTPVSAAALALVMVLAAIYHLRKGEYPGIGFNFVLGVLCIVVAYFRYMGL